MMYKKGLVTEIKERYALVMEPDGVICRIRLKEGLKIGDKIYFVEEDLYEDTNQGQNQFSKKTEKGFQLVAAAAVLLLTMGILLSSFLPTPAYAEISLDGENAVQIQVDKDYCIIDIVSENGSIAEEKLKSLKGKSLEEAAEELYRLLGEGPVLVGVVSENAEDQERVSRITCQIFSKRDLICLLGSEEDLKNAQKKNLSLGRYLVSEIREREDLEDELENMSTEEIQRILKTLDGKNGNQYNHEIKEEMEEELQDRQDELKDNREQEDEEEEETDESEKEDEQEEDD